MSRTEDAGRKRRRKRHKDGAVPDATGAVPAAAPAAAPAPPSTRPPGQRLYDMPFSSVSPRLIKPELGLYNLVARAGENAAYEIDVTLLDAPDHRLIRSGVLLAHRVLDGRGEWFLTAPDWQPLLPKDRIELMGHADLPDELASLIRPLRRRATLGPVAGLRCERREFALRDDRGTTLALLRDDKVTVQRGGLITARYREVMLTPVGPGLRDEQRDFVDRAFSEAGANRVPRFPRLVSRLGAPATGPSDIPEPQPYDGTVSFRRFVGAVIGRRLHELVRCDLAVRGGSCEAAGRLGGEAAALRAEVVGLSDALDAEWGEDLIEDLAWLVDAAAAVHDTAEALAARLHSERYLSVLERLVAAARSPQLRLDGSPPAAEVLTVLLADARRLLCEAAEPLTVESDGDAWQHLRHRFDVLARLAEVAEPVVPERSGRTARLLRKAGRHLEAVPAQAEQPQPDLEPMTKEQAFEAGRELERQAGLARHARQDFLERWSRTARKLDR